VKLTARGLNRATLARQLLLAREPLSAVEAVHRVLALQAQEPASPYLALWNRVAGFDPNDLDRAFADHVIVRAQLMRVTIHAVDVADYPTFHAAVTPLLRAARYADNRFHQTGLTAADADKLLPEVMAFAATPRTNAEADAWFEERLGPLPRPGAWWAFRQAGPFWHHPTGGPWSFGPRPSYVAARSPAADVDRAAAMQTFVLRFLEAFGPSSIKDIAQFSTIYVPPVRDAVGALGERLTRLEGPDGKDLLDILDGLLPPEDFPAPPRLMAMWDSALFASTHRARLIPAEYRRHIIRSNGDTLPTLLVDGAVAGVWRPVEGGVEATAFHQLRDDDWAGLEEEARALIALLADRDPRVYSRYGRWWASLPAAEVRLLH
jgi:DNA glycosylase AlkZ-like